MTHGHKHGRQQTTGDRHVKVVRTVEIILLIAIAFGMAAPTMAQGLPGGGNSVSSGGNTAPKFLGVPLYDDDLYKLVVRLAVNLLFVGLVVRFAYGRVQQHNDFVFTFLIMNVMVFFICFSLKKLELELGMALGLFAIFGIIRYRTDAINVRDMTYLFVVIGLAVINSLSNKKTSYAELFFANTVIVMSAAIMEKWLPAIAERKVDTSLQRQNFVCDDLELLKPENRDALIKHIEKKMGIRAVDVVVKKIDLQAGAGNVQVFFK